MTQTEVNFQRQSSFLLQHCEELMLFRLKDNEPSCFHLASGGSRTRAKLCIEAGLALQLPTKTIVSLACTIELLHNASLVHDDLQDEDITRRGRQSVWKKFGPSHAVCAGDVMISAAFGSLASVENCSSLPSLLIQTQEAVSLTVRGQTRDLDAKTTITEHEYENIAAMKSGPLIQLTLSLPLIAAGYDDQVKIVNNALNKFSTAYQILDDLDDWQQDLQREQLNLVNLLVPRYSLQESLNIARNRVNYLLNLCQKELSALPSNCAASVINATNNLLAKAKVDLNE
ncbi:MAG: polyprenyl synthetase family protein [Sinobacterium sp.]|jgi:geranylgeranyl diphosphate synthase type II